MIFPRDNKITFPSVVVLNVVLSLFSMSSVAFIRICIRTVSNCYKPFYIYLYNEMLSKFQFIVFENLIVNSRINRDSISIAYIYLFQTLKKIK